MRYGNSDPFFMTARYASTCPETGLAIRKGDQCAYFPKARKAFHVTSPSAAQVRALEFSKAYGMGDQNW